MKIGLDVDDVLLPCTDIAIDQLVREGYSVDRKTVTWDFANLTPEARERAKELLHDEKTFLEQRPYRGAVQMVQKLLNWGHEVYFVTAPYPEFLVFRYQQLQSFFPMVPAKNIILCGDKSVIALDVLLDDGPHNLETSLATHRVRWEKPWNENCNCEGMDTARTYEGFLDLVLRYSGLPVATPSVLCLVGPSASGKTTISEALVKTGRYIMPQSVTTRQRRKGEPEDAYQFISEDEFNRLFADMKLVEHTCYNGNYYGLSCDEVDRCLASGKTVIVPVDIHGAEALKERYPNKTVSIFIKRPVSDILKSLSERGMPDRLLLPRLTSMADEFTNEDKCDYVVHNCCEIETAISSVDWVATMPMQPA